MRVLSTYCYLLAAVVVMIYWNQHDSFQSDYALWIAALVASFLAVAGKGFDALRQRRLQRTRDFHAQDLFSCMMEGDDSFSPPAYVLYLRPFSTTGRLTVANPKRSWLPFLPGYFSRQDTLEFESLLSEALSPDLPLIALGSPGEHVGAARIPIADKDWREAFSRLVECATWIVMIPSHEGETRWEVAQLINGEYLAKVIFLMPPKLKLDQINLPDYWSRLRDGLASLSVDMPEYNQAGLFFRLGREGSQTRARYVPRLTAQRLRDAFAGITNTTSGSC